MAEILGYSPEFFYVGTDLKDVDLRGQDLCGIDLRYSNTLSAKIDVNTKFDKELSDIVRRKSRKRYLEVSNSLLEYSNFFFSRNKFRSRGWFYKSIIPNAAKSICENRDRWTDVLDSSSEFRDFFNSHDRSRIELVLNDYDYEQGISLGRQYGGRGSALISLIVVGLTILIGYDPNIDLRPLKKKSLLHEYRLFPANHKNFLDTQYGDFSRSLEYHEKNKSFGYGMRRIAK